MAWLRLMADVQETLISMRSRTRDEVCGLESRLLTVPVTCLASFCLYHFTLKFGTCRRATTEPAYQVNVHCTSCPSRW